MNSQSNINPRHGTGSETTSAPVADTPGKVAADQLPDGSGNDGPKSSEIDDEGRFDAG